VRAAIWLGVGGNEADDRDGDGVSDGPPMHATNTLASAPRVTRVRQGLVGCHIRSDRTTPPFATSGTAVGAAYTPHMAACPSCGETNPDRARFCLNCGAAFSSEGAAERSHETRRRVTVLFSDVAGSTVMGEQLDPEALREVMQRYFDAMRVAIERHEGTVEKFIGDAVMAVFGIPQIHEDDALRAVRAAFDMLAALGTLNRDIKSRWGVELAIRTGINTGEVVAGDATIGQALATGDVVNTAARLEQAAGAGQILIGAETHRLVRHAVTATTAEPLVLKGKADPVAAWIVSAVDRMVGAQARRLDSPMVGRDRQLRILTDAAERSRVDRAPQLVTVLGLAGVGKSRLVHEFLGRIREESTVIRGRCLSYGDAITYWPLSEALREAAGIETDDSPEEATARLRALVGGSPQGELIAKRVAGAIGLATDDSAAAGGQETFWPFAGSSKPWLDDAPSSRSSTTCSGGRLRSSISWSTSPTGPGRHPSCCWRSLVPSCSRRGQHGVAGS